MMVSMLTLGILLSLSECWTAGAGHRTTLLPVTEMRLRRAHAGLRGVARRQGVEGCSGHQRDV